MTNLDSNERIVQGKVAGSSFYAAMKLMPPPQRDAMYAIYAFCRRVDDIADDGKGTRADRKAALGYWRADIEAMYAGTVSSRVAFLASTVKTYGLRKADFFAVIDGMEMDVAQDVVAPDLATLDLYCERVASAVGRLSIKVFGMDEGPGDALSHHLGRALQLTNILRDLDEDATNNRCYLPHEYLAEAGITSLDPHAIVDDLAIDKVCRRVARLAHTHYDEAAKILAKKPKGFIRTPRLMGAVYSEILRRTEEVGWAPPRKRVSLSRPRLLAIVLKDRFFG